MTGWKWQPPGGREYAGLGYGTAEGIAKITIGRPGVRSAFCPATRSGLTLR